MVPPSVLFAWLHMDHAFSADGSHGGSIERKHTLHGFLGREVWVLGAGVHHVEGDVRLFKVLVPVGQVVGGRSSCPGGNEMVLPRSDGSFCWVVMMNVRWSILVSCIFFCNKLLNIPSHFVVQFVRLRLITSNVQMLIYISIGF